MIKPKKIFPNYIPLIQFSNSKLIFWFVCIFIAMIGLGFRLYSLQIQNKSIYIQLSRNNHDRTVTLECPRGSIFDRNGIKLAEDIPTYHLFANLNQSFNLMDKVATKNDKMKILVKQLSKAIDLSESQIQTLIESNQNNLDEFLIKNNLSNAEYAKFNEKSFELPGFFIKEGFKRYYPERSVLSHMIGYTGLISKTQKEDPIFKEYDLSERIGKAGVEFYYELILHGSKGKKIQTINALGNIIDEKQIMDVVKGDNIYLTIDFRLQKYVENLIKGNIGSLIIINCDNGEILAAASYPDYDPNIFSSLIPESTWNSLVKKGVFINRAIQGQYPPGSTFKPLISLFALENNIITFQEKLFCKGFINVPNLSEKYRCWVFPSQHGWINLKEALKYSCDVFFYELGRKSNIEKLITFVKNFGIGRMTGIDIAESEEETGFIGSPEWKKKQEGYPWFEGDSMNLGIGQGFITVTPMQMVKIYGELGNGKNTIIPHLLLKTSRNLSFNDTKNSNQKRESIKKLPVDFKNLKTVREFLHSVVEAGGTAPGLYDDEISISAKTGTAEGAPRKDGTSKQHLWLSSFAPTENPEIAAVIIFEDSDLQFGGNLAPILKKAIIKYFELKQNVGGDHAN